MKLTKKIVKKFLKTISDWYSFYNTPRQQKNVEKGIKIAGKFFKDLANLNEINCYKTFIKRRDDFLKSIGEKQIIKYLGGNELYKKDENGIQNIDKAKDENLIIFFHTLSISDFQLKELSNICDKIKSQKENNQKVDFSELKNFYNEYAKEIMGADKDSDAKLTKFQHLKTMISIINNGDYKKFSQEKIAPIFNEISKNFVVNLTFASKENNQKGLKYNNERLI